MKFFLRIIRLSVAFFQMLSPPLSLVPVLSARDCLSAAFLTYPVIAIIFLSCTLCLHMSLVSFSRFSFTLSKPRTSLRARFSSHLRPESLFLLQRWKKYSEISHSRQVTDAWIHSFTMPFAAISKLLPHPVLPRYRPDIIDDDHSSHRQFAPTIYLNCGCPSSPYRVNLLHLSRYPCCQFRCQSRVFMLAQEPLSSSNVIRYHSSAALWTSLFVLSLCNSVETSHFISQAYTTSDNDAVVDSLPHPFTASSSKARFTPPSGKYVATILSGPN